MNFPQEYFEDQVIDGFYVPSIIKQLWGATLEVLAEFDRVCRKNNIRYFADWGTLLSAVRHKGFIPWDDDLDVCMLREDYNRFMQIANQELKEGFEAYNYNHREYFWEFIGCVIGKNRICLEEDHLKQFHNIPYIVGIDIFVLDYRHRDAGFRQKQREDFFAVYNLARNIDKNTQINHVVEMHLRHIEGQVGVKIDRALSGVALKKRLYQLCEEIAGRCKAEDADHVSQLIPHGFEHDGFFFPKEAYQTMVDLPYEVATLPVPLHYERLLRGHYRDYIKANKVWDCHDYPLIKIQHENLLKLMNSDLMEYKFNPKELQERATEGSAGYKPILVECHSGLQSLLQQAFDATSDEEAVAALMESQQLAIDMGGLIEEVRGEGTATVHALEGYCEALYNVCQCGADMAILLAALDAIADALNAEILSKKEILLLPCKAAHWPYIEAVYAEYMAKEDWEVTVLPLPYFYKNYDGTVRAEHVEEGSYPENVSLADPQAYDIPVHHPDIIVSLNSFDRFNPETSVYPEYYSPNLRANCGKFIYLPPYDVDDFTPMNEKDYYTLGQFLCMPGAVAADEIWVPSETLRQTYAQRMAELVGEKHAQKTNKKFCVKPECFPSRIAKKPEASPEKGPKSVAYYISASYLAEHGEAGLEKIKANFEAALKSGATVKFIPNSSLERATASKGQSLWSEYASWLSDALKNNDNLELIDESTMDEASILKEVDAYYGDGSHLALLFLRNKKPVLTGNI